MHSITIDNLVALPSHSPGLRHIQKITLDRWLFDGHSDLIAKAAGTSRSHYSGFGSLEYCLVRDRGL